MEAIWLKIRDPLLIAFIVVLVQWVLAPFFTGILEGLMKTQSVQYPSKEIEGRVRAEFHRERLVGAVLGLVAVAVYALIAK